MSHTGELVGTYGDRLSTSHYNIVAAASGRVKVRIYSRCRPPERLLQISVPRKGWANCRVLLRSEYSIYGS